MGLFRALDHFVSEALFLGIFPLYLVAYDGVVEVNRELMVTGLRKEAALDLFDQSSQILLALGISQFAFLVQLFAELSHPIHPLHLLGLPRLKGGIHLSPKSGKRAGSLVQITASMRQQEKRH